MPRRVETTESGEQVIGRLTPTGKDANASFNVDPNANRRAARRRQQWEGSVEGQARTRGISVEEHGMTPGQYHFERTYGHETVGPRHYDVQLPGMSDPDAAPRPPKWEELSKSQQRAAEQGARHFGTSRAQMQRDLGTQIDQAVLRAAAHGHTRGNTEDFYGTGRPRQVIDQSARELGIPKTIHAQMNAMTSPNTKFQAHRGDTGEIFYPNDEAARHAVRHVQQGGLPDDISSYLQATGTGEGKVQGYRTNIVKAAKAFEQHERGVRPGDWVTNKAGDAGPFDNSPKTGPYANSWNDTHPQFAVGDVHTGGGGALPHLSSAKPIYKTKAGEMRFDEEGNAKRDKSERELAIAKIPHFHSMMDSALRGAMAERNMPSVRDAQALQWGEERIQRGLERPNEAYPKPQSRTQIRGQRQLDLATQVEKKGGQQGWDFGALS